MDAKAAFLSVQETYPWAAKMPPDIIAAGASVVLDRQLPFGLDAASNPLRQNLLVEAHGRKWLWDEAAKLYLSPEAYEGARQRLHDTHDLTDFRPSSQNPRKAVLLDAHGQEIPLRQAVAEAAAPKVQIVVPELPKPKPPLPPKPQSKHEQIKAALASPILTPPGRNIFAPPAPPKDDWWWEQREDRRKKAEAAAEPGRMNGGDSRPGQGPAAPAKSTPPVKRKL